MVATFIALTLEQWGVLLGIVVSLGAIAGWLWRRAVRPIMRTAERIETAVQWVEVQTRNDGGSSLRDAIDWCVAGIEVIAEDKGITGKLPPRPKPAPPKEP